MQEIMTCIKKDRAEAEARAEERARKEADDKYQQAFIDGDAGVAEKVRSRGGTIYSTSSES